MTPKDVIAQAEDRLDKFSHSDECETLRFEDFERGPEADCYCQVKEFKSFFSSYTKDLLQSVVGGIEKHKTDERKVSVFGKGMDSWEARTYDEKKLVNAVLSDIIQKIK